MATPDVVFDAGVLQHAKDDEETKTFADIRAFRDGRYFYQTKFHEKFVKAIHNYRMSRKKWIFVSGIEGLGKTSSALYYVLLCRKEGDSKVHYVDLNKIEAKDENLETFGIISMKYKDSDCLIVDHVTIHNTHFLDKMKRITRKKNMKFIMIEAGFTTSSRVDFGKDLQLEEDQFLEIWSGSLQVLCCVDSGISRKGKEVYAEFAKRFIMTPKLLHEVQEYLFASIDKTVTEALAQYTKDRQIEIANFKGCDGCTSEVFAKFQLHTTILLQIIPNDGRCIITESQAKDIVIAANIFEVKYDIAEKNDPETDVEVLRLDLNEGDIFVEVRHLVPFLANDWRKRFPYDLETVLEESIGSEVFEIVFQNGGARKEIEKLFLDVQRKRGFVILPNIPVVETSYHPSQTTQEVPQTNLKLDIVPSENFLTSNVAFESFLNDIPVDLKGHEKNVALFAVYLKQFVHSTDTFVLYPPHIQDYLGFDYFVYECTEKRMCPPAKKAKGKKGSVLYLVKIATGTSHRGDTIGQAYDVVKRIFADEDVTLHVVVINAASDGKPYPLTKCSFENISVLNLNQKSSDAILHLLKTDTRLYKFLLQLLKNR